MTTPVTTAAPKPVSVWEDFVDIFVSPAQVFARREKASFFVPLVVLTLVMVALYFGTKSLMQPVMDAEFARQTAAALKANPKLTAAQMESFRKVGETFAAVFVLVLTPIRVLLVGLVLWVVGKFFDSKQTLGAAMVVATYAFFPLIVQQIAAGLIAAVTNPVAITGAASVTLSLARFLDPDHTSKMLFAFAMRVDVFLIWITVLLAIGLSVTGKISRTKAGIAAAVVWLLGAIPTLFQAMRMG